MFKVIISKKALKHTRLLKRSCLEQNAKKIIEILEINPFQSPPPYEKLTGNLKKFFSRRINYQHRLVYEVIVGEHVEGGVEYDGKVRIVSMWSHYEF